MILEEGICFAEKEGGRGDLAGRESGSEFTRSVEGEGGREGKRNGLLACLLAIFVTF